VSDSLGNDVERRVLVLAPTPKDAALTRGMLERAELPCVICTDIAQLCQRLRDGAAALLLPEEAISSGSYELTQWLAQQPPWSDLPVLIIARPGADSAAVAQAMDMLGNVTVLERPTRVAALISALRTAIRGRQRQYQLREYLVQRQILEQTLRDADRRKDEFLATLAHELRNPLAPLRNGLQVMKLAKDDAATVAEVRAMMERQLAHMVRLIDDLLDLSRISRGKIELKKARVELVQVLQQAIETSRPVIEVGRHQLVTHIPPERIDIYGDFARLAQVFANLLNNAAKYTDPGGSITVSVERNAGEAVVRVRDTGVGIPASMLPRVFEMFTQVDHSLEKSQGGLGIGLSLVKLLVEMHQGRVEARSDGVGHGSEFVVQLPILSPATEAEGHGDADEALADAKPLRILVVDDNRDAAITLSMLLNIMGNETHTAHDGLAALAAAADFRPDVALLDIGMPKLNGYDTARRLRAETWGRDMVLVALTGWGQEDDKRRSREAGFNFHLVKPIAPTELKALLRSLPTR
jgi:signal transduction histidine kinase